MDKSKEVLSAGEIGKAWFERVWGERDRSAIYDFIPPDGVAYLEGGQKLVGPEPFAQFHDAMLSAFPDPQFRSLAVVAEGDQVCVHWEFTGSHRGDGLGMPASGEDIRFTGMTRLTVKDGQIVEGWDCWNHGAVMARMGAPDEVVRAQ